MGSVASGGADLGGGQVALLRARDAETVYWAVAVRHECAQRGGAAAAAQRATPASLRALRCGGLARAAAAGAPLTPSV